MFDNLSEKFSDAFKALRGKNKISEDNIEETLKLISRKPLLFYLKLKIKKISLKATLK